MYLNSFSGVTVREYSTNHLTKPADRSFVKLLRTQIIHLLRESYFGILDYFSYIRPFAQYTIDFGITKYRAIILKYIYEK